MSLFLSENVLLGLQWLVSVITETVSWAPIK